MTRLRKSLKSRRVTSVRQIGTDRIVDIALSDGAFHLLLEFFAGGNIILTDREYTVVTLFRQVPASEGQEELRVGLKYSLENKQNVAGVPPITTESIRSAIERAMANEGGGGGGGGGEEGARKKQKPRKKQVDVLRRTLSNGFPEYPPLLLDHAFAVKGVDSGTPLEQVLEDESILLTVKGVLEEAASAWEGLAAHGKHPGYIIAKEKTAASNNEDEEDEDKKSNLLYEDFHPFKPRQFLDEPDLTILEFDSFNAAVDEYFSSVESQKLESRLTEREEAARRKLYSMREDHENRIGSLTEAQDLHIRKAEAILDNVFRVQEAADAINGLIAQGMDWAEIAHLVEMEQERGNPVAGIIKLPLKLYENTITLVLAEAGDDDNEVEDDGLFSSDEEESEEEDGKRPEPLTVDIDLGLSPWANATQYYDQKKTAAVKQQKTLQSSAKALKSHEKKVTENLKRNLKQEKQLLRPSRKPFWFEKYYFFISSEGYLVLGYV